MIGQNERVPDASLRFTAAVVVGAFLLVLLNSALLMNPGSEGPNGDTVGTFISVLWFFGWAAGSVGIGALAGWISGRLEAVVALLSVALGAITFPFSSTLFLGTNSYTVGWMDFGVAAILNIPVLVFVLIGASLEFFARRPDFR